MKNELLPIILGMNPSDKLVVVCKSSSEFLKGFDVFIYRTDYKIEKQPGEEVDLNQVGKDEIKTLLGWLHFTNRYSMKKFGEMLIRYADRERDENNDT